MRENIKQKSPITHHLLPISFVALLLLLALISGCATQPAAVKEEPGGEIVQTKEEWVEETLGRLSLEERISQMIMSRSYAYYYSSGSEHYKLLHHLVKEHKVGGLIFFQGDVYETAEMINRCQGWADVPLLIASDLEWGAAMRIRRATRFPEAMALGATRDVKLAFSVGKAIGEEARALGIHQDFAPVADVNINPKNPVINTRSFGEEPELVSSLASAFMSGIQSAGALATAKHFPGHGDTHVDSHIDLPTVDAARVRLDSVELAPFKVLVERGVASIMVAHLTVPSVDSTKGLPSTLSKPIVTDLLKKELGFDGLIVTDALDMGAVVKRYGSDSTAVFAVEAGADVLLILPDEDAAIEALIRAVQNGRISRERIDYSVRKILGYKYDLGLTQNRFTDLAAVRDMVATPEHLGLAKQVARASITVLKTTKALPLAKSNKKFLNVVVADAESYRTEINRNGNPWPNEPVGNYFTSLVKRRVNNVEQVLIDPSTNKIDFDAFLEKAQDADVILVPLFYKAWSGSGVLRRGSAATAFFQSLVKLGKPTVVISFGSPYVVGAIDGANAYLCAYSDCEASTEAAVEALFGEIPTTGKLPVSIPGAYPYGSGVDISQLALRIDKPENVGFHLDSLAKIDTVINQAIVENSFPGAQVAIVKDGALVYNKSFGAQTYSNPAIPITKQTMFDIASLTKVIATTSAVMKLYDEKKLSLDDTVAKYIPEFASNGKEKITIRNLLLHNSGLPAFKPLYVSSKSPQETLDSVFQSRLVYATGDSTVYSDFGFITLGKIVERITGRALDTYVQDSFFIPLGMKRTMYVPAESLWEEIAPTEYDSEFRKKLVQGVVHDENAYTLGGVSGHAGLFSTASDLAIFMQMLTNGGSYNGKQYLKPETIKLFNKKQGTNSTRALGWDTKTVGGYSSAGKYFSEQSFGHTGFTGTSVWADPEKNLFVIFLTNRVYPTRGNTKISRVRPLVHDAVIKALINPVAAK
ncbi:MAG: beta-N-acetylglucosaminidase [Bacteroidetes bacterium]|nr:MAG: beta-N-acetylglucosaminidase [Bacteroidota bacterium]